MEKQNLPVVVVGAGPVGLAAAAHLVERGIEPLVLEAGASAATAVRDWAHVRLFSPWAEAFTRRIATVVSSVPEATSARSSTSRLGAPPVPMIRRDAYVVPPRTKGSSAMVSLLGRR